VINKLEDAIDIEIEIQRARDRLLEPEFVVANLVRDALSGSKDESSSEDD
jgi:hypothetical protein|tara:strand:- start:759 stop:908 length:150 start_codon:yes stop_codon:yes gene_type:complete